MSFTILRVGLIFCAGVVLIGIGASYLVSGDSCNDVVTETPTCGSTECPSNPTSFSVDVDFYSQLRAEYTRSSDRKRLLSVHMNLDSNGDGKLPYPRTVNPCINAEEEVCATIIHTLGVGKYAELDLTIQKIKDGEDVQCYETKWDASNDFVPPVDCIQMNDFWYGGAEMYYQDWPINTWNKNMSFYLSGDMFADPQQYGSVLERYWLSSQGVAVWIPLTIPLHVSIERQQICFKGSYEEPFKIRNVNHPHHWMQYTTCFGKTPQIVHDFMFNAYFFQRPTQLPDTRMMQYPIWSTWARFKNNINQSVVLEFANEITEQEFPHSQLEIDDGYEEAYGDHTFDPKKFPDAVEMIETLHNSGFRVTTWVTPFINPRSNNLQAGLDNNYFVINGDTNQSQPVPWWRGLGYPIDFTNNKACDWYADLLEQVRTNYGVDSYKFDAGEINYVTAVENFKTFRDLENLGAYTQMYAECAHRLGNLIEIRAAWNCQRLPIFVRMMDKDSNWGPAKGMKTLIPTALTFSLLGYPYILPDMIGGNAYENGFDEAPLPERELYIRWLELSAFLPSMQFSIVPWQYDNETIEIAKKYVALHENEIYDELLRSSNSYIDRKSAMGPIRPIWWVTVDDNRAFTVDDEFLVGDKYLVAPIVNNATRSRDIYLPGPYWRDGTNKLLWQDKLNKKGPTLGGITIYDYPVALDEISWWELSLIVV